MVSDGYSHDAAACILSAFDDQADLLKQLGAIEHNTYLFGKLLNSLGGAGFSHSEFDWERVLEAELTELKILPLGATLLDSQKTLNPRTNQFEFSAQLSGDAEKKYIRIDKQWEVMPN
ncbi:hypothetical protein [Pseudovibrio sp. Tun.PSC04-5.I4]|uniref:hypothetical protein n=1 Tax=Pseudovibrio sp. Tun.PSC04-5.I4 TaxID=1798213 RepID=UPI00088268E4|nr:hypothetical protein [Pseudovibrio sp. Tun.PSC04-5.I4]SDQ83915.1 hypothetical protein SAMN04515695_1597 [Pseudovibrio sp. Tun.PSC04-5.I4]